MLSIIQQSKFLKLMIVILTIIVLVFSIGLSVSLGAADIHLSIIWQAVFNFNDNVTSHQVIQELRLPRALAAVMTGAFLAVSGAVMQGLTRNSLASPSIMGVTNGAAFALVLVMAFYPAVSNFGMTLASFAGAGVTVILIFMIGSISPGGLTPVKLALAGVAIGTLLSSLSSVIALHFQLEKQLGFWMAGGLAGTDWASIQVLLISGEIGRAHV